MNGTYVLEHNAIGILATGATLGVLAALFLLFLLLLCLPWHRCSQYCSCCRICLANESNQNYQGNADDAFRVNEIPGEYPLSIFNFIPPSMLPKLPRYEDCVNTGPPSNDEAPPPPPSPTASIQERMRTELATVYSGSHSDLLPDPSSTPPPTYSVTYSLNQSLPNEENRQNQTVTANDIPNLS